MFFTAYVSYCKFFSSCFYTLKIQTHNTMGEGESTNPLCSNIEFLVVKCERITLKGLMSLLLKFPSKHANYELKL